MSKNNKFEDEHEANGSKDEGVFERITLQVSKISNNITTE
jgi:hypothetical protein